MGEIAPAVAAQQLKAALAPWYAAVENPGAAQEAVLERLVRGYAQTGYGRERGAARVGAIDDYRRAFPVVTYSDYKPLIERVMAGETGLLLYEEPIGWAITRGTTTDVPKFIPMTRTDL
ncbi:MAG: GH3 auxin-responsive promoter family protein, partial [Candidatus Bipolaricaulota bacterium]|nr:GH3 auxin-responsive promoter family protein [Candidatus Bipolaricaulota bacterium]